MPVSKEVFMRSIMAPLSMVLVQIIMTGMLILSKIALNRGIFVLSFLTYRSIIGAFTVAPLALTFEREMIKRLPWSAFQWMFINAVTGITMGIGLYYYGLRDTTATYSSCFYNLIPIVTFFLSVIIRIERLNLDAKSSQIKILGALFSVGGAMVITFYKGKKLYSSSSVHHSLMNVTGKHHWPRGTLFLLGSCLSDAFWYIGQVKLFQIYPSKYWATTLTCAFGSLQSMIVGIILDREKSAWKLRWDLQLLTIVYSGVLTTGVLFCLTTWVTAIRGPTYAAMFNALSLIFVAIIESLFMGQELTIGSLLGMIFIVGGISAFLWGKERESLEVEDKKQPPPQRLNVTEQQV